MKARLLITLMATSSTDPSIVVVENGVRYAPAGSVIEHVDAYRLVHGGLAEAADQECIDRVDGMDKHTKGDLRRAHEKYMDALQEARDELVQDEDDEDDDDFDDED